MALPSPPQCRSGDRILVGICPTFYSLRPLFEHLLDGFFYHLLVLISVVAQRVFSYPAPHQRLILGVIQIDNQCSFHILLWSDSTHSSADAAHAPCAPGGLL